MVGANYMGGKRNTARAKSKDIVGRAQRRHFGKQRLVSALCLSQGNRVHSNARTLPSDLPEIALAHARCDANTDSGVTPSVVFSGDRLYSSTSPSDTMQRNKPSKVLGALDISDHISMRAAIDRILQQPNLVGVNTPNLKETAYIERTETPVAVRRPTEAHLDPEDRDIRHSEIVSKHVFDLSVPYPRISEHEHMSFPETNKNPRHGPTESGVFSPPVSPSMKRDVTLWNNLDDSGYAEAQLFTRVDQFFCTEGSEPGSPNIFLAAVSPLPRSSPFPFSLLSSDNSILDFGTSPRAAVQFGRSDDFSEEDDDCVDATSLRPVRQPIFYQPSRSFSIREGSAGVDETQFTISSFANLDEEELDPERSRTKCCNDNRAFLSAGNHDFRHLLPSEYECDSIRVSTIQEATEDEVPNCSFIDFLSDPHPWETIGRILKLESPEPSGVQSVKINFTKDREGVGYISPGRPGSRGGRSSDASSLETKIDDKPTGVHVASSIDPSMIGIVDLEVSNVDDCVAIGTPGSQCANKFTRQLLDAAPSTTWEEVDRYRHVHEAPSIPGTHCPQNEHTRSSSPLAIISGETAAELDVDMTYDGPCLFSDTDLEDE